VAEHKPRPPGAQHVEVVGRVSTEMHRVAERRTFLPGLALRGRPEGQTGSLTSCSTPSLAARVSGSSKPAFATARTSSK